MAAQKATTGVSSGNPQDHHAVPEHDDDPLGLRREEPPLNARARRWVEMRTSTEVDVAVDRALGVVEIEFTDPATGADAVVLMMAPLAAMELAVRLTRAASELRS